MRNDPSGQITQTKAAVGRGAVITCYAAFGLTMAFLVALLVVDLHETTDTASGVAAVEAGSFGIEELVDLFTTEPGATLPGLFAWQKPRPVTRAEADSSRRR